jgi:EAL domain-containing protein (putative c-di-GMP-specific phosphodiesterase class I)
MINKEEIEIFIQPAFNVKMDNIVYAEVLVRGMGDMESSRGVLQCLENENDKVELDKFVFEKVMEYVGSDYVHCDIGVNLSKESIGTKGMAKELVSMLNRDARNTNFVIELNECTDFNNDIVHENISELKRNGIKVAIDDFGTSNTSLLNLAQYDIDILKLDKAWVMKGSKEVEKSQLKLLKMMGSLQKKLGIKCIVEGIEDKIQLKKIKKSGCNIIQGYMYAKPIHIKHFLE